MPARPEFEPQPPAATVQIPDVSASHRSAFYDSPSTQSHYSDSARPYVPDPIHVRLPNGAVRSRTPSEQSQGWPSYASASASASDSHWDPMEISPHVEIPPDGFPQPMDVQTSPMLREYPARPHVEDSMQDGTNGNIQEVAQQQAQTKVGKFSFGKKASKWGLAQMFGSHGDKNGHPLAPVQENPISSAGSTPSLKRTQSSSTDSRSLSELSPIQDAPRIIMDPKQRKKEAARIQKESEKQRRLLAEKMQKEQARAVLEKSKRLREQGTGEFEWRSTISMMQGQPNSRQPDAPGPIRQTQSHGMSTVDVAGATFGGTLDVHRGDWRRDERLPKARRRDFDDDHSMSSTDLPSGMSVISFATVDSDPGPARLRHRPSALGISRMTSMSSLGTTLSDDFSPSGRSSNSLAMEQQFNDFHLRASVDSSSVSDGGSPAPPPMHMLSLSSPVPWAPHENRSGSTLDDGTIRTRDGERPTLTIPPQPKHPTGFQPSGPMSPYERQSGNGSYPSSPGLAPKSAINPIFKVVSFSIRFPLAGCRILIDVRNRTRCQRFRRDRALFLRSLISRLWPRANILRCRPCRSLHRMTLRATSDDPCGLPRAHPLLSSRTSILFVSLGRRLSQNTLTLGSYLSPLIVLSSPPLCMRSACSRTTSPSICLLATTVIRTPSPCHPHSPSASASTSIISCSCIFASQNLSVAFIRHSFWTPRSRLPFAPTLFPDAASSARRTAPRSVMTRHVRQDASRRAQCWCCSDDRAPPTLPQPFLLSSLSLSLSLSISISPAPPPHISRAPVHSLSRYIIIRPLFRRVRARTRPPAHAPRSKRESVV